MKLRTILLVLTGLAVLAVLLSGIFYFSSSYHNALRDAKWKTTIRARRIAGQIGCFLNHYTHTVQAFAALDAWGRYLEQETPEQAAGINSMLDHLRNSLALKACFLISANGLVKATGTSPDTPPIGSDYQQESWIIDTIKTPGRLQLAMEPKSKTRGIFASHPVRDLSGEICGRLVLQADIKAIEQSLANEHAGVALLLAPDGVVFLSSAKDWSFQRLLQTDTHAGDLPWTGLMRAEKGILTDEQGRKFLDVQWPLQNVPGWTSSYLVNLNVIQANMVAPLKQNSVYLVLSLCGLIGIALFLLFRMAGKDINRREQMEAALQENERFLHTIFDSIQDGISVLDKDFTIIRVNRYMENMYQQFGNLVGKKCYQVYQNREQICPWCPSRKALQSGRPSSTIVPYPSTDAPTGWMELTAYPLKDATGNTTGIIEHIRNITERKRAEEKLRISEKKYRELYQGSRDGYAIVDMHGKITACNTTFCRMLGYSMEEIRFLTYKDITPAKWHEKEARILKNQVQTRGYSDVYEKEYTHKDGHVFPVEIRTHLSHDENGNISGMWAFIRDATERKKAEAALQESRERYRTVLEAVPDPVVVYDNENRITYFNPAFSHTFGWSLAESLGCSLNELVPEENYNDFNRLLTIALSGQRVSGVQSRHLAKDGRRVPVSLSCAVYKDKHGKFKGSVFNIRDISEQKQWQARLRQAQKMEAVGTLAGGVAHDFNNLLQVIQGFAELLQMKLNQQGISLRETDEIVKNTQKGRDLTQQLLTFSRKMDSEMQPVDLNMQVREVELMLQRIMPKMIRMELKLAEALKPVYADSVQIEQVLLNLAVNARDAMPAGGNLYFQTQPAVLDDAYCKSHPDAKPGEYVLLSISDTGIGIDKDTMEHIFVPFFSTKEPEKGTGLGLAIVYGIIKHHNGYISCYSEPGQGTTFDIYLPVSGNKSRPKRTGNKPEQNLQGRSEKILFVDDERALREVGEEILGKFGYQVALAATGEEALDVFDASDIPFDLIVLDLFMPGMGGHTCLKELLSRNKDLKIIVVSGYANNGTIKEVMASGAECYLKKPYNIKQLLYTVRDVLDGQHRD